MAIVYDVKTGDPHNCEPVDAAELIASGQYRGEQEEAKTAKRGRKPSAEQEK